MAGDLTLLAPLWLLLLPVLLLWLGRRRVAPGRLLRPLAVRFPHLTDFPEESGEATAEAGGGWSKGALVAAVALAVLALAQPARVGPVANGGDETEAAEMILVVGTAITMGLQDYVIDGKRVDRMTLTRRLLDRFVADYPGRRVGLVVLGDPPALWLPPTGDKAAVRHAVGRIRTTLGGRLTDIGAALRLVGRHFGDREGAVVVVFSDAGTQVGHEAPARGAEALAAAGLTVYTIAMGSADPTAGEGGAGRLIYTPVNLPLLQDVARAGGGEMFHALDAASLTAALETITARHRQPRPAGEGRRPVHPLYPWPLGAALLMLLAAQAGPPRHRVPLTR